MSHITDTVDTGAMTHSMRLVIPERFCSADISSEGDTKGLMKIQHDVDPQPSSPPRLADIEEY